MPTIIHNALSQLTTPVGFWLGAALPAGLVLLAIAILLGLQGLLFAFRVHLDSLHDLLRAGRRVLLAALVLVFAAWCLCTALIALWHGPYREWLVHAPTAGVLPVAFHAGGVLLWVMVSLLLARRGVLLAWKQPEGPAAE